MCRLYGLVATEPTRIECALVHAQNALMEQSREDPAGLGHAHGWGIASYENGLPRVEKQAWAAYHGEQFKKAATRSYSTMVIAHVRRATLGAPGPANTHPFTHGRWVFAHNGTVKHFERVRIPMIEAMDALQRNQIQGDTDSEHVFRYLLSLWERFPSRPLHEILKEGVEQIVTWSHEVDPGARFSLNILWGDGERLVGSRFGRMLWYLEREGVHLCEICGEKHVHHKASVPYRSVEIASEPITKEAWLEVPNETVFSLDPDMRLNFQPLGVTMPPKQGAGASAS